MGTARGAHRSDDDAIGPHPLGDVRHIIGLMSGTSCDGVDAALVRIEGEDRDFHAELIAFHYAPYGGSVRAYLMDPPQDALALARINMDVGEYFAQAVDALRAKAPTVTIDAIGSHGHTVAHAPPEHGVPGATLQLGSPAVIAERTGICVVSDFRSRDMAVGGQGAPLVPFADALLFRDETCHTICLNIGGISNLSVVAPDGSIARAFDTGPGNMIIDAIVQRYAANDAGYDRDGALAAAGTVDESLSRALMDHAYFQIAPPKSTGREMFGFTPYLEPHVVLLVALAPEDAVATITDVVAASIFDAVKRFVVAKAIDPRIVVSGGGAYNPTLMKALEGRAGDIPVLKTDALGWPADSKEAVAFALLADAHLRGVPANVPAATGAGRKVILGSVTPGT